jgi:hypothetical protein
MKTSPGKHHPIGVTLLCLALAIPVQGFAQSEPAVGTTRPEPRRPAAAPAPQLLQQDELQELSARNQEPDPQVRGGALTNEHLTYIVIALAAAVLVLVLK